MLWDTCQLDMGCNKECQSERNRIWDTSQSGGSVTGRARDVTITVTEYLMPLK